MTLNAFAPPPRHRRRYATAAPVRIFEAPDGHDVVIEGRLDVHTVPDIRDAIHDVITRGPGELRLHLGSAEIGDATGLGVIVHLHRRATRADRRMLLFDASDRTTRLLRGCRLDRILVPRHSVPMLTVAPLTA